MTRPIPAARWLLTLAALLLPHPAISADGEVVRSYLAVTLSNRSLVDHTALLDACA